MDELKDRLYYPLNVFYKSVTGAIKENEKVTFRIKGGFSSVCFVCHKDGEIDKYFTMESHNEFFEISIDFSVGIYWYCFKADDRFIGCGEDFCGVISECPEYYLLSVYASDFRVPDILKGGIIYQIFPDRFNRSKDFRSENFDKFIHKDVTEDPFFLPNENGEVLNNDFYGGNLKGITEKLSYLKTLNVSAIYLNPIFKAFSNHRYDTGDYMQIDPLLGDENDFKDLILQANKYGIVVIIDGVFNHVGADSIYFNKYGNYKTVGAYQSKDSRYYEWFNFFDYPDGYESWWGIKTLPQVNENNADYREYICGRKGVIRKYFDMGVKGVRLDVVDELPDDFVKEIRKAVKSADENAIVIGEVWEDASVKIAYDVRREYFLGAELDSVMNYPLKNAILDFAKYGDANGLSRVVKTIVDRYPKAVIDTLMNILSTHDTARLFSALSDENALGKSKSEMAKIVVNDRETAISRLKVAVLLQYTLMGVPSVYYGDEAGAEGFFDPLNRRFFPWENINKEINAFYVKLGKIRRKYDAFIDGEFNELYKGNGFYAFTRTGKTSEILVVANVKDKIFDITFDGELEDLISGIKYKDKISAGKNFIAILKKTVLNS